MSPCGRLESTRDLLWARMLNDTQFSQLCEGERTAVSPSMPSEPERPAELPDQLCPSPCRATVSWHVAVCFRDHDPTPSSFKHGERTPSSSPCWRLRTMKFRVISKRLLRVHIVRFKWSSNPPQRRSRDQSVPRREYVRRLATSPLRSGPLVHFVRWWRASITRANLCADLTESTLFDMYASVSLRPPPSASTSRPHRHCRSCYPHQFQMLHVRSRTASISPSCTAGQWAWEAPVRAEQAQSDGNPSQHRSSLVDEVARFGEVSKRSRPAIVA